MAPKWAVMLSLAARRAYEAANSRTKVLEGRYTGGALEMEQQR